jgi:hypothetical protein
MRNRVSKKGLNCSRSYKYHKVIKKRHEYSAEHSTLKNSTLLYEEE